jgi:hypothetical protein
MYASGAHNSRPTASFRARIRTLAEAGDARGALTHTKCSRWRAACTIGNSVAIAFMAVINNNSYSVPRTWTRHSDMCTPPSRGSKRFRKMENLSSFPSLALFQQTLEFKASLLDSRVDTALLQRLDPSPAEVFREAQEADGASIEDIKSFLRSLKQLRDGSGLLMTRDGLDSLTNVIWEICWKVCPHISIPNMHVFGWLEACQAMLRTPGGSAVGVCCAGSQRKCQISLSDMAGHRHEPSVSSAFRYGNSIGCFRRATIRWLEQ